MALRIAFAGLGHGHIFSLYKLAQEREDLEIAGACEEDVETREGLAGRDVPVTHNDYEAMLSEVECDVIACGGYYGRRGHDLARALETGHHVIADKPICTRLADLERIEALARERSLCVGCQLDLPNGAVFRTLREVLQNGAIGEVHTVSFSGQHPLNYGKRPQWYFEEGKHGGTINDLAIHAIDYIPWATGRRIVEVTAARAWNARLKECPFFQDGAQMMLRLDNDGGVLGDVSYLTPESHGYVLPAYWRFELYGSEGYAELCNTANTITVYHKDEKEPRNVPIGPGRPGGYLEDFLSEIGGRPNLDGLHTARVLESSRIVLQIQAAADTGVFPQSL